MRREEADAAVAEAPRSRGEAIDIVPVQEVSLECLCGEAVGGLVVALSQQADFPDRGLLGTLSLATELESRQHVLTQWGHERSPCFSGRVIRWRRKTSSRACISAGRGI